MTRYIVATVTDIDIIEALKELAGLVTVYLDDGWVVQGGMQVAGPTNILVRNGPGQGYEVDPMNGGFHHEEQWVLMQPMIGDDDAIE